MKIKVLVGLLMVVFCLQNQLHTQVQSESRHKAHSAQKNKQKSKQKNRTMNKHMNKQGNRQRDRSRHRNHKVFSTIEKKKQNQPEQQNENRFMKRDGFKDSLGESYKTNNNLLGKQREIYGSNYNDNDDKKEVFNKDKSYDTIKTEMKKDIKDNQLTDDQIIQKYPNMYQWLYSQSSQELEMQNKLNSVAQTKYIDTPAGGDDMKDLLYEGEMLVRMNYYGAKFSDPDLHPYYMRLNDKNLYASGNQGLGYRGINGSIAIKNIYDPQYDDVRMGQCCQQIGIVKPMTFGDVNNQAAYYCFSVEDYTSKIAWTICNSDYDSISDLRQYLILAVIKYGLSQFGIFGMEELMKFQKLACDKPTGWNYNFQSRWPCMCPEGMMQSPINIVTKDVVNSTRIGADFRRWDQKLKSYIEVLTPQENYAVGSFGSISFRDKSRSKTSYQSEQIRFKFPSEHQVNGKEYPGEMQIVHNNGDSKLIVSVFLTNNKDDLAMMKSVFKQSITQGSNIDKLSTDMSSKEFFAAAAGGDGISQADSLFDKQEEIGDKFFENMSVSTWDEQPSVNLAYDKNPGEKCIQPDNKFTLYEMFKEKDTFTKSFYTYQGSDTKPACKEDVQWIIMKDPMAISTLMLNAIKRRALVAGNVNTRKLMPTSDREVIGFDECPRFDIDIPGVTISDNANLVKAKVKKHWYAIVYPGTKTMFDDLDGKFVSGKTNHFIKDDSGWKKYVSTRKVDHLDDSAYYTMESMDENKMNKEVERTPGLGQIRQDLRYQLGSWLVDNREKIMNNRMAEVEKKYESTL